ncbi:hypothetical protein AVEN_10240-1 [Araneus ventricosus]|uniref:RING-type domain-containing protein n=1 Tax=Araneus ventricosus TaxID=182803 RepID=A0A4Y2FJI4_ARAVE|nr:hypothetical protein AVEN_10240-1 [Araneus ventricosus]
MNENNIPVTNEASVITSFSQSSYPNDIIDLTEINDSDECEVTSSCSVIVSNNSVNPQQPGSKPVRNRRRKNSNSSTDDSICILYEKIQPPPDIEVVNEVIIDDSGVNESANNDLLSIPIPPVIMGSYTENSDTEFQQIPPLFPEISSGRTDSSSRSISFSFDVPIRALQQAPHHSTLPSCKYATVHKRPSIPISVVAPRPVALQRISLPTTEVPLSSKTLPDNLQSHGSDLKMSNIEDKVPKIQCGICLDGPDEIAASGRNFTSTNCGHVFCNECIATSLKNFKKCPKCRKKVTSKQIHPLYL